MRAAVLVLGSLFFLTSCSQSGGRTDGTSGNRPIPIAAADLKWAHLDPAGAPGVKLATLWGDPARGMFCILQASRRIHRTASHAHTSNERHDPVRDLHSGTGGGARVPTRARDRT